MVVASGGGGVGWWWRRVVVVVCVSCDGSIGRRSEVVRLRSDRARCKMTKISRCPCIGCLKKKLPKIQYMPNTSYHCSLCTLVGQVAYCGWRNFGCPGQPRLMREFF